jgi:hypothetical protein
VRNPRINAGDLRHRVTWQTDAGGTIDSEGQYFPNYSTVGSYYALVEATSGDEVVNADQLKGVRRYHVTMRNVGQPKPSDILIWNGITLNIISANIDPFGVMLSIEASELIASQ